MILQELFYRHATLTVLSLSARIVQGGSHLPVSPDSCGMTVALTQATPTAVDLVPYPFPNISKGPNAGLFQMPRCRGIEIDETSIDELQEHMQSGRLSAVSLAQCFVNRMNQVDRYVNSVLELNPDWLAIAAHLDAERATGRVRSRLHGIPFLVKDNIASKDKMETTAGSWALLGSVVPRDAFVVSKLRSAGALLLGKATLSEWADMRSTQYSEGYSARGGQARSAYNLTVNPGGSSSGSAIAVACNIVPFSLGTETDGSVINPAERNSIVGIKPTFGLISRDGVIPECIHQDTVGVFGKSVRDAVLALDAIYGVDARDNYTCTQVGRTPHQGYTNSLSDRFALRGARFGLPWKTFWAFADAKQQEQLLKIIDLIKSAGALILNGTELPDADVTVSPDGWNWKYGCDRGRPDQCEYTVVTVDFYNNIKEYLAGLTNTAMRSLEDLVQFNLDNDGTEGGRPNVNPAFASGQDTFLDSLNTRGNMDKNYWDAVNWTQSTTRWQLDTALGHGREYGPLDALLIPSDVAQTYQVADQAGYPMITIPAGFHEDSHMPFGLGFVGSKFSDARIIRLASAVEDQQQHTGTPLRRQPPMWYGYMQRNLPVINA